MAAERPSSAPGGRGGDRPSEHRFSSRLGLILSVLGIAVGTGNIWRFPRIVAQNGGEEGAGAFLIPWLSFLLLWSVPLIVAEYALGRAGRAGVVGTFLRVAGRRFAWMGAFVGLVSTVIFFYYSVVAGWCAFYVVRMVGWSLPESVEGARAVWDGFQGGLGPVVCHALAIGCGVLAVTRGVASIERINKVLIPSLLCIVVVALVRALTLEGAGDGIAFLFTPEWRLLARPSLWLEALTQNAWDTGAGWGLILTYGAYMQRRHGVVRSAVMTGVGNNLVSLLAATVVFSTTFAILGAAMPRGEVLEVMRDSGPASTGLTFIWMPQLFARMAFGKLLAILFFLGLTFAAFSSLIAMIELPTRVLVDFGLARRRAVRLVGAAGFLLGLPSALSTEFLGNQDFVWGVALMISGAFCAFAVMRRGARRFREDLSAPEEGARRPSRLWSLLLTFVIPAEAIALLGWWLYVSATEFAPDTWYDPLEPYSVMTCLAQWGVALVALLLANRWLVRRTTGPRS